MKSRIITLLFLLISITNGVSQNIEEYTFTYSINGVLEDMTGSSDLIAITAPGNYDNIVASNSYDSGATQIGFPFVFQNVTYSTFDVNTNGLINIGSHAHLSANNLADYRSPAISPYWDDLHLGANGKIHYIVKGTAPFRKLIIEFIETVPYSVTGNANAKFQCTLEETTNVIEFIYGEGMLQNTYKHGAAIGLLDYQLANNVFTKIYNLVDANANTNTTTSFFVYNTVAIPAGTKYRWTPPSILNNELFVPKDDFKTYPNPVKNTLYITSNQQIDKIIIYNLLGQEMISKQLKNSNTSVDVSSLPKGNYFIKYFLDEKYKIIKITKE